MSLYHDLFVGVWQQAIIDDTAKVVNRLRRAGFNAAYDLYCERVEEPLLRGDKKFLKFKADLREYSKIKARPLDPKIRQMIYQEAKDWPNNRSEISRSVEFEEEVKLLEAEVEEFAVKRMENLWRRL